MIGVPCFVAWTASFPTTGSAFCPAPAGTGYEAAAQAQFRCSSNRPLKDPPADERQFVVKLDFPAALPSSANLPWVDIDFQQEPEAYLRALLAYGLKDNSAPEIDWRIEDNTKSSWCHAPWFHNQRERLHGMTLERSSRLKELHELQTSRAANWAVGFYNDIGCYAFGKVWDNPAFPRTKNFSFPVGTYSIKLLFTAASPREVPFLTGSKEWNAAINDDGSIVPMRLLQVDVAVRDSDADAYTGWVFGTFMYDAYEPGETVWERLVPVGLMWGNDPDLVAASYEEQGQTPRQGWVNPAITEKFYHLPRHNLGLHGRVNGPVDNPKSACLACHGRALDWGRGVIPGTPASQEAGLLRPFAPNPYDDKAVRKFFRNLKPHEPFVAGTQSLDYSLQLSDGLMRFRAWVAQSYPAEEEHTSDVPPYEFKVEQPAITSAEGWDPTQGPAGYLRDLAREAATPTGSSGGLGRGDD